MIVETLPEAPAPSRRLHAHAKDNTPGRLASLLFPVLVVLASIVFPIFGGGNIEPGPKEGKLGMTAWGKLGPYGEVYGGWEPSLLPGKVLPTKVWSLLVGGAPTDASLRWPLVVAALAAGAVLSIASLRASGKSSAFWTTVCWMTSVGLMELSETLDLDMLVGVWTIAAVSRINAKSADFWAGVLAGMAFLAGGWPPLAVCLIACVVLGKRSSIVSFWYFVPQAAIVGLWSLWASRQDQLKRGQRL